jgi:septum formation topological specificity factor MinE
MQSTLEEVELSAVNGNHVFGAEHSKALEGLRVAQIELAKAWARSEADDVVESVEKDSKGISATRGTDGRSLLDTVTDGGRPSTVRGSTAASGSGVPRVEKLGSSMQEETDADILLARQRREANDRYFQRVNGGVLEVVAKLEEVAKAMKAVEQESRDIWGETESDATSIRD